MGAKKVNQKSSTELRSTETNVEVTLANLFLKMKPYILPVIMGLLLVLVITIGAAFFINKKGMKNAEAYFMLHKALDIDKDAAEGDDKFKAQRDDLEKLIKSFPNSPVVKDAKFYLAKVNFSLGKLSEAARQFAEFYQQYPNYEPFSTSARIAEANCLMEKNDFSTAKSRFEAISADSTLATNKSGVVESLRLKTALCDVLLGNYEKAKTTLNSLLASANDESLKEQAQSFLAKMEIIPPEELKKAILPIKDKASTSTEDSVDPGNAAAEQEKEDQDPDPPDKLSEPSAQGSLPEKAKNDEGPLPNTNPTKNEPESQEN